MSRLFRELTLWCDGVLRSGPTNMAIDDWLLRTAVRPTLRVYRWEPGWGSLGYFGDLDQARSDFPELKWVRRCTGGGTVDHTNDWTYTLVVPKGESLASLKGAESYHIIHELLGKALVAECLPTRVSSGDSETGIQACFANPVKFDLVDPADQKVAGAGQRRTRQGLLHQGSVRGSIDWACSSKRGLRFASLLTENVSMIDSASLPGDEEIDIESKRYVFPEKRRQG